MLKYYYWILTEILRCYCWVLTSRASRIYPGRGASTYYLAEFSQKLHEIEIIFIPGGVHASCPLRSATAYRQRQMLLLDPCRQSQMLLLDPNRQSQALLVDPYRHSPGSLLRSSEDAYGSLQIPSRHPVILPLSP